MSIPEPTDLAGGLDYLSTLAPQFVRAVPAGVAWDALVNDTPMQYQFRSSETGEWNDKITPALNAIEREHWVAFMGQTTGRAKTKTVLFEAVMVKRGHDIGSGITRSAPDILTARVLALVAFLMLELEKCAR